MLTVESLKEYGANVTEGVARCLDDADFYLDLVKSAIPDDRIDELERLLSGKDYDKAFEVAHALKGMYGNISLTPIYKPISEITELLREKKDTDYAPFIAEARAQKEKLIEIANSRK